MTDVHSSRLQFTRDGKRLVVAERDRVVIFELASNEARRDVSIEGVAAIAAFADQLWVTTSAGELRRWDLAGRELDGHASSVDPESRLVPTTVGGPAALGSGTRPTLFVDDLGRLASVPAERDAIPIAGRRLARIAGSKLTLPSGTTLTLEGVERIIGGCAILDAVSLALVTKHGGGRELHVVAVASGRIFQRVALPPGIVRIAARRGIALVQHDRDLALVDLRLGRSLGTVVADQDVCDVAIDPDATQVAFRAPSGEVQLVPLVAPAQGDRVRSLATRQLGDAAGTLEPSAPLDLQTSSSETCQGSGVIPVPTAESPAPSHTESDPSDWIDETVQAFEPRQQLSGPTRDAARAALDREIRSVMLRTVRAIAAAWNTRRLGYGNEGTHPFEHEVAALAGSNAGFAAEHLAIAERAVAEHEATVGTDPLDRAECTPIVELAEEFRLSPLAIKVLLLIAAPSISGDLARLYNILANDAGRSLVDELLVGEILGDRADTHDLASELCEDAALVRFGLVRFRDSRARPFTALEVDPVILARLRGVTPSLGRAVQVRAADRPLAELDLADGTLLSALDVLSRTQEPARIAIHGRAGTGRRSLLAALAARAHRCLGVIDATALPREPERFTEALRGALRRVLLAGLFPVVGGLEDVVLREQAGAELARDPLAAHPGPLAVLAPLGWSPPLPNGHATITLPTISETQRLEVWQRALENAGRWTRDAAQLAARYRIGPGVIRGAITAVARRRGDDASAPCDDAIDMHLRRVRGDVLGEHARNVERKATWNDLVLPSDVMDSLRELVGRVRHRRTVFEQWGMGEKVATSRGLTALFQGQPGTGKTLVAGVIARELGLDLYQVDLSKVMSKWIGETERNLAKIFDAADDGQAILLFDEADSLFARRTEVRSSNDRYANLEVNYLLQRLDSFDGFAILTTNSGGSIDPAFKRRLTFQLSFPFPDEETRAALWRAHLPPELPRAHELTFDALARKYQLSGGYIRNACLRAAFLAAQEERPLHQEHLERAVALEFAEQGKLTTTGTIA